LFSQVNACADIDGFDALSRAGGALEHFQEKWAPVFRQKMRQCENARAVSIPVYVKPL
jgi:hypothetical protein